MRVLDTPAVQRLRYVRQLGHAFLVYPGATHTRFEHALGAYHLTKLGARRPGRAGRARAAPEEDRSRSGWPPCSTTSGTIPFPTRWRRPAFPHHEALGVARARRAELGEML